jgi:hypothetical protein
MKTFINRKKKKNKQLFRLDYKGFFKTQLRYRVFTGEKK